MVRTRYLRLSPAFKGPLKHRSLTLASVLLSISTLSVGIGPARADQASDHLQTCATATDPSWCKNSRDQFVEWFPRAYKGDYQGQRNVAYCLFTGCDGAVQRNPALACAWRQVIIRSGSNRVDASDKDNLRLACGRLDQIDTATATAQASRLERVIGGGRR